jgi:hypothetical protein
MFANGGNRASTGSCRFSVPLRFLDQLAGNGEQSATISFGNDPVDVQRQLCVRPG